MADSIGIIYRAIAEIDRIVNLQLNLILHNERFCRIESSWYGLSLLVQQAKSSRICKIKIFDATLLELYKDFERSLEPEQASLYNTIYSDEYGIAGGEPFGVILGDYEFSHSSTFANSIDYITFLANMAKISAAAFCPFISNASPSIFGLDSFTALKGTLDLNAIFSHSQYQRWWELRRKKESRFIGLAMPRLAFRGVRTLEQGLEKGFYYYDLGQPGKGPSPLWGGACIGFGLVLIREFLSVGWFGHIRGARRNEMGGGVISIHSGVDTRNNLFFNSHKPIVDVVVSDPLERQLSELGFIVACQCQRSSLAVFYSNPSLSVYHDSFNALDKVNARLSSMLQYVLCASRVAHHLKILGRDMIGTFATPEDCERYLSQWLFKYTTGREDLDWEEQAKFPLRGASVTVKDSLDDPGKYFCIIRITPHYQLDGLVSELELVTELTKSI